MSCCWIAVRFSGLSLATINHLAWGDMLWMNRFDPTLREARRDNRRGCTLFPTLADLERRAVSCRWADDALGRQGQIH